MPVSGGLQVGAMTPAVLGAVDPRVFYVFLPSDSTRVCVEISSKDGRYEAKLEYDVRSTSAPEVALRLPTQHGSRLSKYSADDLVILSRFGPTCSTGSARIAVSSWHSMSSADTILVYVNSSVPTFIVSAEGRRMTHESRCNDLTGTTVAYNLVCVVPSAWIERTTALFIRKRERTGSSSSFNDIPLLLTLKR